MQRKYSYDLYLYIGNKRALYSYAWQPENRIIYDGIYYLLARKYTFKVNNKYLGTSSNVFFIFEQFGAANQLCGIQRLDTTICYDVCSNLHSVIVNFCEGFNEVPMVN